MRLLSDNRALIFACNLKASAKRKARRQNWTPVGAREPGGRCQVLAQAKADNTGTVDARTATQQQEASMDATQAQTAPTRTAPTNFTSTDGDFWTSDAKWVRFVVGDMSDRKYEEDSATLATAWKWNNYRLGDGFKGIQGADNQGNVCKSYPGSILCEYLQKRTRRGKDWPTLLKIIDRRIQEINSSAAPSHGARSELLVPDGDVAVVHLRLGDGLCARTEAAGGCARPQGVTDCWKDDRACFRRPWGPWVNGQSQYAFSEKHYANVLPELQRNQTVIIVSEMRHWTRTKDPRNGHFEDDFAYRRSFAEFLRKHGFAPLVRKSGTPDEDFLYMAAAQTFVPSGGPEGGFCDLAASAVKERGGKVVSPQ